MPSQLYRHLRISCVGVVGVAIGLLAGSRLVKTAIDRPLLNRAGDAEEALNRVIPEIDLEETPFNEAVERIRKLSPVPIIVRWEELAAAWLDTKSPVTFRARDVTLGRVLSELVKAVNTANASVTYAAADDLIQITTDQGAALVVRSYDVRDILRQPDPWEDQIVAEPVIDGGPTPVTLNMHPSRLEALRGFIQETVEEETLGAHGGGVIRPIQDFDGRLVTVQTWEVHRKIAQLLADIRKPTMPPGPVPPTPDLKLWNGTLKKYVSTSPSIGEASLKRRIPEVRFDRVPFKQAVTALAEAAHADVIVDWGAFEAATVKDRTPISVNLHDVTLAEALRAVLDAAGAGQLDLRINGGFVVLGLSADNEDELTTRVYDMGDWLAEIMGRPPTRAPKGAADLANWNVRQNLQIEELVRVIEETTAADSWKETGGTIGSIKELNRQLIVTQTWENQERVADLLAAIRTDPSRLRSPPTTAPATAPAAKP